MQATAKEFMLSQYARIVEKGYTMNDLADESGMSAKQLSEAKTGKRDMLYANAIKIKEAADRLVEKAAQ